jgi:hypothetical protein
LRDAANRLAPGDGAAAAEVAVRMRAVADQVERGDSAASADATGLIVDVARAHQAGQLTDGATITAIQLLQTVPGVAIAGSATAVTAATAAPPATGASPEIFVPTNDDLKDKPDKGKGKGQDD